VFFGQECLFVGDVKSGDVKSGDVESGDYWINDEM